MIMLDVKPIGIIRSEHTIPGNTPIQPVYAEECSGSVEIFPEYADGLMDIEGFSHIILLYWLHKAEPGPLLVKPFLQDGTHGIFATRAPGRPNPIGISIVRLINRDRSVLHITGIDILDETPVLDIKPYSSIFDCFSDARNGWQEAVTGDDAARKGKRGYKSSAGKEKIS